MAVKLHLADLYRVAAAVLSGMLLALAFPPWESAELAWVALIPLLVVARTTRPRACFRWGFLGGLTYWLMTLAWLLRLARTGTTWPVAILGWVMLSAYSALYTGAFLVVIASVWQSPGLTAPGARHRIHNLGRLAVTPLAWVGLEYLRSALFTGFAWNPLGVSQFRNLAMIQGAAWGGVYVVSALVVLVNASLCMMGLRLVAVYRHHQAARLQVELMAGLLVMALCWVHGVRAVRRVDAATAGVPIRVACVQPNVAQLKKWPPEFASMIYARLEMQTERARLGQPDLVVWPETAVPGAIPADQATEVFVKSLAREGGPILAGAMESGAATDELVLYNSSFLYDGDGRRVGRYRKQHLVPFGEYLPFDKRVGWIRRMAPLGFSCTPGDEATVFRLGLAGGTAAFSALICFEDTVAGLARHAVRAGARFLVNQTNDAWFDRSAALVQHMSHSVFRAVENRVTVVRAANSGVTCSIDRAGRIDDIANSGGTETGFEGFQTCGFTVPGVDMPLTVYTRRGDAVFALPCAVLAALALAVVLWTERNRSCLKN